MIAALGYVFLGATIVSLVVITAYMRKTWREEDERAWEEEINNMKGWG